MSIYSGYFTFEQLKRRGWNQGLIDQFLLEHDALRKPSDRSQSIIPVKLYSRERTMKAEARADFPERKTKKERQNSMAYIENVCDKHFLDYVKDFYDKFPEKV